MKSMTGYAYEEISTETHSVSVEIKCYNSRFLDLTINLPSFLNRIENKFREICTASFLRGKVDVYIKFRENNSTVVVEADTAAARAYMNAMTKIAAELGRSETDIPLSLIAAQEGVLVSRREQDPEFYFTLIEPVFKTAVGSCLADRLREGENLKKDLLSQLDKIEQCAFLFSQKQPEMETIFKDSIIKRFTDMLGDSVDMQRVMQETAAMMMKYTINEEIVRLSSHLISLKNELNTNPAPGRKIDFICQEINREINTIGSKNQLIDVGQAVISAKDALENIREQARNIE